jgi:eukaryotic-like serine/threonine-protein kinase
MATRQNPGEGGAMSEQHGSTSFSPGTVLAGTPHLVRRELGSGGVGTVYETYRLDTGERRAVKVLSSHVARHPALEERLLHEAEVLSVLRSPHVIGLHGGGRLATGEAFYEMDLLEGETLRETLGRGPLAPPLACGLVAQALGALHVVHLAGLVHRDVKPDNLFLRADGVCVLLDFGAVKILTEGRFSPRRFPTDRGKTFGTVRYMPPEAGFFTPDARADVFAAGVVLAELLAGGLDLAHLDDGEYLEWLEACGFPVPDDLPEALRPIVECATARSPDDRYPSAAAFADDLARACREAGIRPVGVRPLVWAPRLVPSPRHVALRDLRPVPPPRHAAPALEPSDEPRPPSPAYPAAPVRSRRVGRVSLASAVTLGVAAVAAGAASLTVPSWASAPVAVRVAPEPRRAAPAGVIAPTQAPAPEPPPLETLPEPPPHKTSPPDVPPSTLALPDVPPPPPGPPAVPSGATAPSARSDRRSRLEAKLRSGRGTMQDAEALAARCRTTGDAPCVRLALTFLERYGAAR